MPQNKVDMREYSPLSNALLGAFVIIDMALDKI